MATYLGYLDIVRELLARGANFEAAANKGWTSLLVASKKSRLDSSCVQMIAYRCGRQRRKFRRECFRTG